MGFSLIFYGLNLMTGGLKPLRAIPEVMSAISSLRADDYIGLLTCVGTAALVTAMIHSSSATIGIVMGLGASGVLDWQTAVAFSRRGSGDDDNVLDRIAEPVEEREASGLRPHLVQHHRRHGNHSAVLHFHGRASLRHAVVRRRSWSSDDGKRQGDLPARSRCDRIVFHFLQYIQYAASIPFVGVFDRVLSRIGHDASEDIEDYSLPKYLAANLRGNLVEGVPALRQEIERHLGAGRVYLDIARGLPDAPKDPQSHNVNLGNLSRDIGVFASTLLKPGQPYSQADLVASLIEEADFAESLGETLNQIARRVKSEEFSPAGRNLIESILNQISGAMGNVLPALSKAAAPLSAEQRISGLAELRRRCLRLDELAPTEEDRSSQSWAAPNGPSC